MPITQAEFEAMLQDDNKHIEGDIQWSRDEDDSPAVEFRVDVLSSAGYPLEARGRYNSLAGKLSYLLTHRSAGRVYALDLGADHHNPTCQHVGDKHKHKWSDVYGDKHAYVPDDITFDAHHPVKVWQQFCKEANIMHAGTLGPPPPVQEDLLI